jgi:ribonucleoside-diphosphate reductase alpha chain
LCRPTIFPISSCRASLPSLLDPRLATYALPRLAAALKPERDLQFGYLGLQTLYDRYFLHIEGRRIELPQIFFMRVAMGLALNEIDREARAIEFYHLISSFDFMCSTPTLFNSGTLHSQLSSCYLTTVADDLERHLPIDQGERVAAEIRWWTGQRLDAGALAGQPHQGHQRPESGRDSLPEVVNDTAVAVNQGGKRKGAVCAYLETWHLDIEEFLDLRKNTGDERRRTHDMNTANWIPDLFMKRVMESGEWTLFSPVNVPDLHEKFGAEFEAAYMGYEALAATGQLKAHKKIPAVQLWRKMLTMLFETGHPWITFKDACNLRSPQQHVGVVHSSNLCTEITLNTSDSETAVCNLGSVNLLAHLKNGELDQEKLSRTVRIALRMLDNVVDINFYATPKARNANLRHRPVGLGIMGFADCLYNLACPTHRSRRRIRRPQHGSGLLSGLLGINATGRRTWTLFQLHRQPVGQRHPAARFHRFAGSWPWRHLETNRDATLDWAALRERIAPMACAIPTASPSRPTATISNIVGVSASIEPSYQNLYVKSNLSGEFTVVNEALVRDLKALDLWDEVMVSDLKYFDGSLARIERIPDELKARYATAFEIDPTWLIEAAARRQKWIDQAQSLKPLSCRCHPARNSTKSTSWPGCAA